MESKVSSKTPIPANHRIQVLPDRFDPPGRVIAIHPAQHKDGDIWTPGPIQHHCGQARRTEGPVARHRDVRRTPEEGSRWILLLLPGNQGTLHPHSSSLTLIHAAASSQGYSLQVQQSLIVGIGLACNETEDAASIAAATGKLAVRLLLYNQLKELRNDKWTDLLSIVVALLCFDPNREQKFEKARTALQEARLDNFIKASEALVHISKPLQDATTAFGKEYITDYNLFQMVRKKLSREIRFKIDSILSDGDSLDQLHCDWQ